MPVAQIPHDHVDHPPANRQRPPWYSLDTCYYVIKRRAGPPICGRRGARFCATAFFRSGLQCYWHWNRNMTPDQHTATEPNYNQYGRLMHMIDINAPVHVARVRAHLSQRQSHLHASALPFIHKLHYSRRKRAMARNWACVSVRRLGRNVVQPGAAACFCTHNINV